MRSVIRQDGFYEGLTTTGAAIAGGAVGSAHEAVTLDLDGAVFVHRVKSEEARLFVRDLDLTDAATVGVQIFDHQIPLRAELRHVDVIGDRDFRVAAIGDHAAITGVDDATAQIDDTPTRTQRLDDQLCRLAVIDQREIGGRSNLDCGVVGPAALCGKDLVGDVLIQRQVEHLAAGLNGAVQVQVFGINGDTLCLDVRRCTVSGIVVARDLAQLRFRIVDALIV